MSGNVRSVRDARKRHTGLPYRCRMATFGRANVADHDLFARDQGIGAVIHLRPTTFPRRDFARFTPQPDSRQIPRLGRNAGGILLAVALSLAAMLLGGLARAPWWFWLVGAGALALLMATDPDRLRPSYADARRLGSVPLLFDDLKTLSMASVMSAAAFALGSAMSLALPH